MQVFLLILATMFWGAGFVGARFGLEDFSSLWVNLLRFFFASLLFVPIFVLNKSFKIKKSKLLDPFLCAFFLFVTFQTQTLGLQYTTIAKSGFITTLYALFTPIIQSIFFKTKFRKTYWLLVLTSLIGVFFLCELKVSEFNRGDVLTLICAIFASMQIIWVDIAMKKFDSALEVNGLQTFFLLLFFLVATLFFDSLPAVFKSYDLAVDWMSHRSFWGILFLSAFSTFIAFTIQTHVQKNISAHIVSIIFLMESFFASIFGVIFFNEPITINTMIGSALIFTSVLLIPKFSEKKLNLS